MKASIDQSGFFLLRQNFIWWQIANVKCDIFLSFAMGKSGKLLSKLNDKHCCRLSNIIIRPFNLHLDFWKSRSWEIKKNFGSWKPGFFFSLSPGFFSGYTVNQNGLLASKTVWHEILLRYMIFAYHWIQGCESMWCWQG